MNDINTAAELQHDLRQSDAANVLDEIERELTLEAEALIGSAEGMYKLFTYCEPDVIPNLVSLFSCKKSLVDTDRAITKLHVYLLSLAKDMLRDEVEARAMEERESIEYGYEG